MATIYLITCLVTGKYYVGQTTWPLARRWSGHKTAAKKLQKHGHLQLSLRKYGPENHVVEVLTDAPQIELNRLERLWVIALDATNQEVGMNLTFGGDGSGTKTKEERAAISLRMMGNQHGLGSTHAPEERVRIGLRSSGRPMCSTTRMAFDRTGKTPWNKGKKASPEQIAKQKENYWEKRKNAASIKEMLRRQAGNRKGKRASRETRP